MPVNVISSTCLGSITGLLVAAVWLFPPFPSARIRDGSEPAVLTDDVSVDAVSLEGAARIGRETAPVIVIEFSDFECPFCRAFARNEWPTVRRDLVESGRILFIFENRPLEAIHDAAMTAAETAQCAGRQERFWQVHDLLFAAPAPLTVPAAADLAPLAGLDAQALRDCIETSGHQQVMTEIAEAERLRVTGTPTFFVGLRTAHSTAAKRLRRIPGVVSARQLREIVESVLGTVAS